MLPLLAGLSTALLLAAFAWVAIDGLWRPDAFDYAQIARELAEGRGFSSRHAIYALHLEFLEQRGLLEGDWPNLHRFPLPSLCMALGFRVFGAVDAVVVGYGILFHAATATLLFAWARAVAGIGAAVACVLLLVLSGTQIELATSGLAEPPVLFFFTLSLYALWRQERAPGVGFAALAGVSLGLAGLARTNALFAAPLLALALGYSPVNFIRRMVVFAGALALVSLPWWLRNLQVADEMFFSLHTYFLLPSGSEGAGSKWDLFTPWVTQFVPPGDFLRQEPAAVFEKWGRNLLRLATLAPSREGVSPLLPLVFLAALRRAGAPLVSTARWVTACFFWNAFWVSFGDFVLLKYHLHLAPAVILVGVTAAWSWVGRLSNPRARAAVLAVGLLLVTDLGGTWRVFRHVPASTARYDRDHWKTIRRQTGEDAVIVSDQSHAVAWETGRRSVRLHFDRRASGERVLGVLAISDRYLPVDAVYLSRQFLRDPAKLAILDRTLAGDARFRREFPRFHQFEEGGLLFRRAPTPRSPGPAGAPGSPDRPARPASP